MSENNSEKNENCPPLSPLKTEENENFCWSPRFEFDAPRYTNFSSKKFKETRRLLNKLVLNREDCEEGQDELVSKRENISNFIADESDFEDLISFTMGQDSDSSEIDEWFNRFHPLHEPLRPMTPPGPLISPEKLFTFKPQQSLKASPKSGVNCELNTPSKGPNTRIGLRSKPARVLKSNSSTGSFDSSPSSLVRSNFSTNHNNNSLSSPTRNHSPVRTNLLSSPIRNHSPIKNLSSPIRNFSSNFIQSSPLKQQNVQQNRQNSVISTPTRLSSTSNTSSITLSVSSLTKTFYYDPMPSVSSPTIQSDLIKPSNSPLKMKTKFSEGVSSPLRKAVGILQLEDEHPFNPNNNGNNLKKRLTETLPNNEVKRHRPVKIEAELEDIKKLLSQHNNRIRPHNSHNNNNNKKKS